MKIICLGDSLTAGIDRKSPDHWINILHREAQHTYINKGICGDTSGGMLTRFYRDVVECEGRSAILMGGSNDFIMGADLGTVQANMMALVHQAFFYQVLPVIGIPVCGSPEHVRKDWAQFSDFFEVEQKQKEYRKWLHAFASVFHLDVLDFQQAFEVKTMGDISDCFFDGVHPNKKGNRIMADLILEQGM